MLLAYKNKKLQAIVSALIIGGVNYCKWYFTISKGYDPNGVFALSFLFILIGYQANNYNNRQQELTSAQQIREFELKESISINLHDSITNQLSFIILLTSNKPHDTEESPTYSLIEESAQSALQSTRQIIDMLTGRNTNNANGIQWTEKILELVTKSTVKLEALGIHGKTSIQWEDISPLSLQQQSFVFSLLEEIYFNLLKHCSRQCEYFITVKKIGSCIYVNETNTIDSGKKTTQIYHSGKGLSFKKKQIENLRGTLEFGQEDMIWTLHARMPIY